MCPAEPMIRHLKASMLILSCPARGALEGLTSQSMNGLTSRGDLHRSAHGAMFSADVLSRQLGSAGSLDDAEYCLNIIPSVSRSDRISPHKLSITQLKPPRHS